MKAFNNKLLKNICLVMFVLKTEVYFEECFIFSKWCNKCKQNSYGIHAMDR